MKAAEILEVESLVFAEPSFPALTDPSFNILLAQCTPDQGRLLLDEHEEPIALAFHTASGWYAGSFLCRNPSVALIDLFEDTGGEIFQEDRETWAEAVRDYFSGLLLREVPPAFEDLNPVREENIRRVIEEAWGSGGGIRCIDCGCGSGVGSLVLRKLGYSPLSFDNDPSLLARGLAAGRLLPGETMCIDATAASAYLRPVPRGIAIMAGEINTFSQDLWQRIIYGLLALTDETLITVGTEPEAQLVRDWGQAMQRTTEIRENNGDEFYDRWVCSLKKNP